MPNHYTNILYVFDGSDEVGFDLPGMLVEHTIAGDVHRWLENFLSALRKKGPNGHSDPAPVLTLVS
jgi:hypothetical protein